MQPSTLFYVFIAILVLKFLVDQLLDSLNASHFEDVIPEEVSDVYDSKEYKKSQGYKKTNHRFGIVTSLFSILLTLSFIFLDGFSLVDSFARTYSENTITIGLIFFLVFHSKMTTRGSLPLPLATPSRLLIPMDSNLFLSKTLIFKPFIFKFLHISE